MENPGLSERAYRELQRAKVIAAELKHPSIGTGHLLLAIVSEAGFATTILANRGLVYGMIDREVAIVMALLHEPSLVDDNQFTLNALRALNLAMRECARRESAGIGTEHLLLGLAAEETGVAATALRSLDVGYEDVKAEVTRLLG